jgi:hypothetical protein
VVKPATGAVMVFKLDVNYSEEELKFIREHNCSIPDEIKLSKTDFSGNEYPRRVFQYGSAYIAEILEGTMNLRAEELLPFSYKAED